MAWGPSMGWTVVPTTGRQNPAEGGRFERGQGYWWKEMETSTQAALTVNLALSHAHTACRASPSRPHRVPAAPAVPERTQLKLAWPRPARSATIPAARWLQPSCSAHGALPEAMAHGAPQMCCAAWGGVHEGEPVMLVTDGAGPGTLT